MKKADLPARPAEGEPDRKRAVQDLIEDLDSLAASASHVPDEEMEALIDEATWNVRQTHSNPQRNRHLRG
jgi:hypothetical protein